MIGNEPDDRPAEHLELSAKDRVQRPDTTELEPLLTAIAHPIRRSLVQFLSGRAGEPMDISDCIDHLESSGYQDDDDETERSQLAIALHHTHLPSLSRAGVIQYDPDASVVEYTGPDDLLDVVEYLAEFELAE